MDVYVANYRMDGKLEVEILDFESIQNDCWGKRPDENCQVKGSG